MNLDLSPNHVAPKYFRLWHPLFALAFVTAELPHITDMTAPRRCQLATTYEHLWYSIHPQTRHAPLQLQVCGFSALLAARKSYGSHVQFMQSASGCLMLGSRSEVIFVPSGV